MRNLLGALLGAAIDRRDGDSGIKGAMIGFAAQRGLRTAIPMLATYAVGWAIVHGARRAWAGVGRGDAEPRPEGRRE